MLKDMIQIRNKGVGTWIIHKIYLQRAFISPPANPTITPGPPGPTPTQKVLVMIRSVRGRGWEGP